MQKHEAIQGKVRGDIHQLPFQDGSFHLVTANVAVDHVEDPHALLAENHRVLRPGGGFLFHTPNLLSYATLLACMIPGPIKLKLIQFLQNRKEEDVFPTRHRLNISTAARTLAQRTDFRAAKLQYVESSARMVILGPLVVAELLWIQFLRLGWLRSLRTNIIAVLGKAQPANKTTITGCAEQQNGSQRAAATLSGKAARRVWLAATSTQGGERCSDLTVGRIQLPQKYLSEPWSSKWL